jgi:hypothetical protein
VWLSHFAFRGVRKAPMAAILEKRAEHPSPKNSDLTLSTRLSVVMEMTTSMRGSHWL